MPGAGLRTHPACQRRKQHPSATGPLNNTHPPPSSWPHLREQAVSLSYVFPLPTLCRAPGLEASVPPPLTVAKAPRQPEPGLVGPQPSVRL